MQSLIEYSNANFFPVSDSVIWKLPTLQHIAIGSMTYANYGLLIDRNSQLDRIMYMSYRLVHSNGT